MFMMHMVLVLLESRVDFVHITDVFWFLCMIRFLCVEKLF